MSHHQTRLRVLTVEDAAALADLGSASEEHLRPWDPARPADYFTLAGQTNVVTRLLALHDRGQGVPFGIFDGRNELVGRITISGITRGVQQSCSIGYWIGSTRVREGHATRAVSQAVAHAFTELDLHRVEAATLPENVGSQAVLRRNGFVRFGLAQQYLHINGAWRDHVMFQIINPAETG